MSATKDEIMAKFRELDKDEQLEVFKEIQQHYQQGAILLSSEPTEYRLIGATSPDEFDGLQWLENIRQIRHRIDLERAGKPPMPPIADFINELREERDEEILRSLGFGDFSGDSDE